MLLVYTKYTGSFPINRLVFTVAICAVCMSILLFIMFTHRYKEDLEIMEMGKNGEFDVTWDSESNETDSSVEIQFPIFSEFDMKRVEDRMRTRRNYAKDVCTRLDEETAPHQLNPREFYINEKHHLIWCSTFKAASTTWLYYFNILGGVNKKQAWEARQPQNLARSIYPRPDDEMLLKARADVGNTAFIIVRHPFERLSSAYRDKMQNSPTVGMNADLAEEIIMEYRKGQSKDDESFFYPPWPSFEEFVRYILFEASEGRTLDIHWTPFTTFCTPCQFDFDVIIKFETMEEDQQYLIQKTGLSDIITPKWMNSGDTKTIENGKTTTEIVEDHFSQLSKVQVAQLYNLYRFDFMLFNYTADAYYSMAHDGEEEDRQLPAFFLSQDNN